MQPETNNEFILKKQTYLIWNLSDSDWPEKVPGHLRNTCVSTCVVLFHAAWVYSCECISQVVIVIFPLVSSDLSPLCGLLLPSCCCIDLLPSQRSIKFNPTPSDLIWAPFSFLCVVTVLTTLLSCFLFPVQVMAQQATAGRRYLRAFVSGFFVAVPVTVTVLDRFAYVARVEGASMQVRRYSIHQSERPVTDLRSAGRQFLISNQR